MERGQNRGGRERECFFVLSLLKCLFLFLCHTLEGVTTLGLNKFEAKIGQGNEPSICMFKKLHFEQVRVLDGEGEGRCWKVGEWRSVKFSG